jgi:hypothetical protein
MRLYSTATSDEDGRFSFQGLAEGTYELSAKLLDQKSQALRLEVREGLKAPPSVLVLEPTRQLHGRIVSSRGPRPGALFSLAQVTRVPRPVSFSLMESSGDGSFSLAVPRDTVAVTFVAMAPGAAARIALLPTDLEAPLEVWVPDEVGTLRLELPPAERSLPIGLGPAVVLRHGGAEVPLGILASWAEIQGQPRPQQSWTLPMMEVGEYRLCHYGSDLCASGYLPPGGELELRLPPSEGAGALSRQSP